MTLLILALALAGHVAAVWSIRWENPWFTSRQVIDLVRARLRGDPTPLQCEWKKLDDIPPALREAFDSIDPAPHAVSVLFLWPGRDPLHLLGQIWFTPLARILWGKRRSLEILLNVTPTTHLVYGAAATAKAQFDKPLDSLTPAELRSIAALLAQNESQQSQRT
jgi:hypothetical protein